MVHNQLSFYQTFHCIQLDIQNMDIGIENMISIIIVKKLIGIIIFYNLIYIAMW